MLATTTPPAPPDERTLAVESLPLLAPDPDSDRLLLIRAGAGDDRAFARIVDRYTSRLHVAASRILPGSSDVDDVVQETFLAAWTHLDTVIDGESIAKWLHTTLRRRAYDRLRHPDHRRRSELADDIAASDGDSPAAIAERSSFLVEVGAVLRRMPALQRRCWELRHFSEFSYDEIAEDVGISVPAVRGYLARGRSSMRTALAHWR